MQWIEKELHETGLLESGPSVERVRVFAQAFGEVIDMLPSYRPFLLSLQKEYDGVVQRLQDELNALAPLEGRLKTMKAESFSFVGESMTMFHMEIGCLRKRLAEVEQERAGLQKDKARLEDESAKLQEASEKDRYLASESHLQNLDILKHLERMEKQVESLKKQEKELHGHNKDLEARVKEKESRIQTVEEQLNEEREKIARMVPREDCEALKDEIRHWEIRYRELEETYNAKQKDYMSLVEIYSKSINQKLAVKGEMRPLTPRPRWRHCRGLLDPDAGRSGDKAETAQQLLQHLLACSRTLLSAYGLAVASQKSTLFATFAKHALTAPLSGVAPPVPETKERSRPKDAGQPSQEARAEAAKVSDAWLPADEELGTPKPLRHAEKVKNFNFSRKKTADFIDSVIQLRSRTGYSGYGTPFLQFMLEHLGKDLAETEATEFAINVFATVRRYAAEPDFLAYLLLILGRLPDMTVRDNKGLCPELLRIFTTHFETGDGTRNISKQKFFYGLREVLQNKDPKMWQDLVTYFPAGGPDVLVNYEWLLLDDFYILSPIVYALRLQHLEESLAMADRLEAAVRGTLAPGATTVKYAAVQAALKEDPDFGMLQPEDYAKAFGTSVAGLKATSEQDCPTFLELMRHGEVFHGLFPVLPSDDAELAGPTDM